MSAGPRMISYRARIGCGPDVPACGPRGWGSMARHEQRPLCRLPACVGDRSGGARPLADHRPAARHRRRAHRPRTAGGRAVDPVAHPGVPDHAAVLPGRRPRGGRLLDPVPRGGRYGHRRGGTQGGTAAAAHRAVQRAGAGRRRNLPGRRRGCGHPRAGRVGDGDAVLVPAGVSAAQRPDPGTAHGAPALGPGRPRRPGRGRARRRHPGADGARALCRPPGPRSRLGRRLPARLLLAGRPAHRAPPSAARGAGGGRGSGFRGAPSRSA